MKRTIFLLGVLAASIICRAEDHDSIAPAPKAGEIVTGTAIGLAVNGAVTEVAKHFIHEMRPDRSANNSFPSRHTSWAFAGSTILSGYLYQYSPWYSLGAHALAGAIGAQRIIERRHYASDVIFGGVSGIVSGELGLFLSRKIFGQGRRALGACNDFRMNLAIETGAVYSLANPTGAEICTGDNTALRFRAPLNDQWGLGVTAEGLFTPVKAQRETRPLTAAGLRAGANAHFTLPGQSFALEPAIEGGAMRLTGARNFEHSGWSFSATGECALSWRITQKFACRATAHLRLTTLPDAIVGAGVSLSSVAYF